ncbi:flavin reductase family protein [Kroppenstedtia pulmonis]|uniref:flavin reductase family protein n=1 Tax=Kroppenstedtia pulmonis TaxID=1380685 RepID=UPI001FE5E63F|nr:flavin reductase family protein [Kroppenstedtia pulmonis]
MLHHRSIHPKILYYGTPVLLLTTLNEDGSTNISPLSSSWALDHYIVLGIATQGKAYENLKRCGECVINLPDSSLWKNIESLAPYTGKQPVPEIKQKLGFRYCKDKFKVSGLTPQCSTILRPVRIRECPLQIEARVLNIRIFSDDGHLALVETEQIQVHASQEILTEEEYIDPASWKPLIYNFRHYFGLGEPLGKSFRAER